MYNPSLGQMLMNNNIHFFRQATTRNRHVLFTVLHSTVIQRTLHWTHYAGNISRSRGTTHPTVPQQARQSMRAQPAHSMYSVLLILVQLTNSGRPKYVSLHQGPKDDFTPKFHLDLINGSAINILNDLNNSPAVEAINPIRGSRHDHS